MTNHYRTLGLEPSATAEEVKRAWRAASLQWHPDRCKAPDAATRFAAASEAYATLSDPVTRARFDLERSAVPNIGGPAGGVGADILADIDVPARMTWTGGRATVTVTSRGISQALELQIPVDAQPGRTWRFRGRGHPGRPPGDLVVTLRRIEPDPRWHADGLDLHGRLAVTLSDLYEGASVTVEGPAGALRVPLPARDLKPIRVRGQGRAAAGRVGDLVLELDLVWPRPDPTLAAALRRAR